MKRSRLIISLSLYLTLTARLVAPAATTASNRSVELAVRPVHCIVVDAQQNILLAYSNSGDALIPEVRLGSEAGPRLPYSPAIARQYAALKPLINYYFAGVVYRYDGG